MKSLQSNDEGMNS